MFKPLIYAVDDVKTDRELYECKLSTLYNVRTFANYTDCLHAIKVEKPAVILCDLILPMDNGWNGIHAVQEVAPDIALIVATCVDSPMQHQTAEIEGLRFWPKHNFTILEQLINECLEI